MTHLRIEQSDSATEQVSSAVIKKLYDLAISGDLDNTSNLQGRLHTTVTYKEYVDVLCKSQQNPSGMFPNLYISSDNYYILFQDPEVERILKDSIGDGVGVTLTQAANANIHNTFANNTNITSFNEFDKFTNSQYEVSFMRCTNLANINLSKVTTIASLGFQSTSLTISSINTLSSLLTRFGAACFMSCTNISGVVDISRTSVTELPNGLFTNISGITGLIIPTTVITFGYRLGAGVVSSEITTLKGVDNVTSFGSPVYGNINNAIYCKNLESGWCPILCSFGYSHNSTSALQLYMPKYKNYGSSSITGQWSQVDSSMFCINGRSDSKLTIKLLYFKDLYKVGWFDFYTARIKNLVINNSTPPTFDTSISTSFDGEPSDGSEWRSKMFGPYITTIYVPDSAVATYQADSNYNAYTIRGINEVDPNTNQPYLTRYATNDLWEAAGKPEDALIEEYMN